MFRKIKEKIHKKIKEYYGTKLLQAIESNDPIAVEKYLEKGADVNVYGHDRDIALYWAAWHNNKEFAQLLLRHGANANAKDKYVGTALMLASRHGHLEIVKLLQLEQAKNKSIGETRMYARLLDQGSRNKDWVNEDGVKASVFLALPEEILLYIAVRASKNKDEVFPNRTQYGMASQFFNRPPTTKADIMAEEKYIVQLKHPSF